MKKIRNFLLKYNTNKLYFVFLGLALVVNFLLSDRMSFNVVKFICFLLIELAACSYALSKSKPFIEDGKSLAKILFSNDVFTNTTILVVLLFMFSSLVLNNKLILVIIFVVSTIIGNKLSDYIKQRL